MHSYTDPGSGALVFVKSPDQIEIDKLKDRVSQLEALVLMLARTQGVKSDVI